MTSQTASDAISVRDTPPEKVETKFNKFITVGKLVDRPELARLYIFIHYYGPVTRPQIQDALDLPKTTVYGHTDALVEHGIAEVAGDRPAEVTAEPILIVENGIAITPTFLHAVALQSINNDIADFADKHGVGKLAASIQQAGLHYADYITQRMAADPLGIHTGEAMLIIDALRPVIAAGREYDPYFDFIFPDVGDDIEFSQDIDLTAPAPSTRE